MPVAKNRKAARLRKLQARMTREELRDRLAEHRQVAERLLKLRGNKTQDEFAAELTKQRWLLAIVGKGGDDINSSRVSQWESGSVAPTYTILRLYQAATGASLDWIVLGVDPSGGRSTEPVYLGRGWPQTTFSKELRLEAKRLIAEHIRAGDFDDLAGLSVGYGPSEKQLRKLAEEYEVDVVSLLVHMDRILLAFARTSVSIRAWEQLLRSLHGRTSRARARADLHHAIDAEQRAAMALLNDTRPLRARAEESAGITTRAERRKWAELQKVRRKEQAAIDRRIREIIREKPAYAQTKRPRHLAIARP